ncbi:MAG: hypothetical protein V1861_07170 [Candidatus Micrarchaeota archaeon]
MQALDFPLISHSPKRWAEFVRTRTPILESIIPLDSHGRRYWKAVDDNTLVSYARWRIDNEKIEGRKELGNIDGGLYNALLRRKLLDETGLGTTLRRWRVVEDDDLLALARKFIAERGVGTRPDLCREDSGLYQKLRRRKLLDKVGLKEKRGHWFRMGNDELVENAKCFIAKRGISGRMELRDAEPNLYLALVKRKRMGAVGLRDKRGETRDWSSMGDEALVAFVKRHIAEKGIEGRAGLKESDGGLYRTLLSRALLDSVGLGDLRGERKDWRCMKRKELVAFAANFIREGGIRTRKGLEKTDRKLYSALRKRRLLDAAFSNIESSNHKEAVDSVLDALGSFGDEK